MKDKFSIFDESQGQDFLVLSVVRNWKLKIVNLLRIENCELKIAAEGGLRG